MGLETFDTWQDFYRSDLQGVLSLLPVPALFLAWLLASRKEREAAQASARCGLLHGWAIAFCALTLLDPIATGPLTRLLALPDAVATAVMFAFVWLGDFRVLLLVFLLTRNAGARSPYADAAVWTCVVPISAGVAYGALGVVGDPHSQLLWILYEVFFLALALAIRARVVPARAHDAGLRHGLRRVLVYAAVYYALWATSDLLIVGASLDAGWALRAIPNQLYYAFTVPFCYWTLRPVVGRDPASGPS